ncbi:hypothetical protein TNIN_323151 [Trichonephila inaurata madagascariensis]|uniref:Endonuclease/exonuclease/phosphatase domain-containing protein n=1 Tax=Trichonephila inaurata madagascariensis TaxID=2747483 RepID=A0A8X6YHJ5_9ARAC|nr:hypothetical protein TNIN_323151 [Trichonephila inaurata madagascariensis]
MEADNIDCALVQEPHSYRSSLPGYPSTYRLFYDPNSDIIKAAIIVRSRHLSIFIDYKNTDYNMVTLEVITGSTSFTLFSYYFEPSKSIESDLHKISQVFSSKNLNRLVWSMDSNSKSELWFSPYSDARRDKLSDFISANNLFIINEDCGPTFRATQGTSHIDITVVGSDLLEKHLSWCLSENESLSDHNIYAKIPRGCLLSPTLFNIYVYDIPITNNTEIGMHADDTAILCEHNEPGFISYMITRYVIQHDHWFTKWKIPINTSNTEAIFFVINT